MYSRISNNKFKCLLLLDSALRTIGRDNKCLSLQVKIQWKGTVSDYVKTTFVAFKLTTALVNAMHDFPGNLFMHVYILDVIRVNSNKSQRKLVRRRHCVSAHDFSRKIRPLTCRCKYIYVRFTFPAIFRAYKLHVF